MITLVLLLLSKKSEVEQSLKDFVMFCRTSFNRVPKTIRSDRGGEHTGRNLIKFLESQGISVQLTTPYSLQQNGKAERKNRTLIEMARCMLRDANLPSLFGGSRKNSKFYTKQNFYQGNKFNTI